MKKVLSIILIMMLIFSLTACQNQKSEDKLESTAPPPVEKLLTGTTPTTVKIPSASKSTSKAVPEREEAGGILVAYFSRWGNTYYPDDVDACTSASITHGRSFR